MRDRARGRRQPGERDVVPQPALHCRDRTINRRRSFENGAQHHQVNVRGLRLPSALDARMLDGVDMDRQPRRSADAERDLLRAKLGEGGPTAGRPADVGVCRTVGWWEERPAVGARNQFQGRTQATGITTPAQGSRRIARGRNTPPPALACRSDAPRAGTGA